MTNILNGVTNIQHTVGGLTNLSDVAAILQSINWGSISNIGALTVSITNILDSVTNTQSIVHGSPT